MTTYTDGEDPDVYIAVMTNKDKSLRGNPWVFASHKDVETWVRNGWCTERIGFEMEVLKHADWHGAGLIKLTKPDHIFKECKELYVRVYVSKIRAYEGVK